MNNKIVIICGASGTGKSRSLKNLNPDSTFIINVLGKSLPWKGSAKDYSDEKKNLAKVGSYTEIIPIMKTISEKRPEVKTLVLDDIGYSMTNELMRRMNEKGYEKYNELADHMYQILIQAQKCREDLVIVFIFHEDLQIVDGYKPQREIKLAGRFLKKEFKPEELVTVLLYSKAEYNALEGKSDYTFVTNQTNEYPSKSPESCFPTIEIPNDINEVVKAVNEYYD